MTRSSPRLAKLQQLYDAIARGDFDDTLRPRERLEQQLKRERRAAFMRRFEESPLQQKSAIHLRLAQGEPYQDLSVELRWDLDARG
jgi:hypothetical protein